MIKTILNEEPVEMETSTTVMRPITLHGLNYDNSEFKAKCHTVWHKNSNEHYITIHQDKNLMIWGGTKNFDNLIEMVMIILNANTFIAKANSLIAFVVHTSEPVNGLTGVTFSNNDFKIFINVRVMPDGIIIYFNDYIIGVNGKSLDLNKIVEFIVIGKYLYETSK
ncbi:MAG TPA: hypothetical protein PLE74_01125 [Candidatus Cloacimonadota bacterium]|nr:hypothetical protein [Candidatus Cloacimonadota bacterium]